jgi:outer membrane receptor for ferrienterochelin and colicin
MKTTPSLLKSSAIVVLAVVVTSLYPAVSASQEPPPDPAFNTLPSIIVTATPYPIQRLIDRKVYSVTTDLQSLSGTAADVLNQVPSVEVDADGSVSLRGNSKVTILVDGKPSAQLAGAFAGDALLQIPASEIDKIEIMNTPPAQYKAEGSAGIINIITKKSHKPGPSGNLRASVGNKHRYVLGGTGNYNAGPLNLSGSIGLRHDTRERIVQSNLVATDPITKNLVISREDLNQRLRRQIPSLKAGIDYRLNEHQSLGFSLTHRERSGNPFYDQHDASVLENGSPLAVTDRHSDGHEWSLNSEQTVRFAQVLRQPGETLDLSLHRAVARERDNYAYSNTFTVPVAPPRYDHLNSNLDFVTKEFSADYSLALSKQRKLKLGYDFQEDNDAFSNSGDIIVPVTGLPAVNPAISDFFRYLQKVHSAYVSYQMSAQSWSMQAGARVEHSAIDIRQITGGITSAQRYTRLYPTIHVERTLSEDSTLSLSLSRRVSRPEPQELNPFSDRQATHHLRTGNPNLLPQDTRSFEVAYSVESKKLHYDLTGYLRKSRNTVTDVTRLVSADVVLTTKANLPNSTSGGFEFTANGRVMSKLLYGLSGNLFYNQIDAVALGATGLKSTTGLNLKASLDYQPTPLDTAQVSFSRSDKRLTPQGYISAINLVNVGYKRRLTRDLSAVFTISDLLNGQKIRRFTSTPVLTETYQRTQVGRIFYIGFVYVLGPSKKNKANGFDYDD